ncbi:MAG: hypothetical protein E6H58_05190 [Betaproteobacteria bacterium]|nr:MAG: hypothetical protein E6H58_05190 [Betaproteobacteria bacterium]
MIDLATLSVKTSFNAYYASLSPDSSKVAFVRFYPLHFTVNPEDQYYVVSFDDAGAAPVNRTGSATDPLEPAGIRILTVTGEQRDRANVNVPPDDAHQVLGNFTWSADGRVLGFVDGVGKHPPRLVTASFGGTKPEVKRYMVQSGIRPDGKLEIDLATPTSPALVRIQRQQGGVVSRALVNLGAPEVIPQ